MKPLIKKVIDTYNISSKYSPTHLVILKAEENLNKDEEIVLAREQYYKDFEINNETDIDIICDETIFRRVLKHHINKP